MSLGLAGRRWPSSVVGSARAERQVRLVLEPGRLALPLLAGDLVLRQGVEEAAADHGVADEFEVPRVLDRVLFEDYQVGELAGFERAQVGLHANVAAA